jgi:hypothetical protein
MKPLKILIDLIFQTYSDSAKKLNYEIRKYKGIFLITDKLISLIIILLLALIRPDTLVMTVYFLIYPYLLLTDRKKALHHLILASSVSLLWMLIANEQYGYNKRMLKVFGLNAFPLFAWAAGLFGIYLLYAHWEHLFKPKSLLNKILLFLALYWPVLILVETLGYHVFNIKNLAAAQYSGLPICDCLHAPFWMKISYFTLGPIYFLACQLLGLENPHYIKKHKK